MKKLTISAVTAIAALTLAGQALAFGGMGGGNFGSMGRGGSFGPGMSTGAGNHGSSFGPESRSRFSGSNPGKHLGWEHTHSVRNGSDSSSAGHSGSHNGSGNPGSGTANSGPSHGSAGSTGGNVTQ